MTSPRYRIALWTPVPPLKTGIADYVDELLPFLRERYDVEIFVDDGYQVAPRLQACYKVFPYRAYDRRRSRLPFDLNIYQMGNNVYHLYIYEQLLRVPGLVVIHDLSISSVLYNYYAGVRHNGPLFRQEFRYSEGEDALEVVDDYVKHGKNDELFVFFAQHPMLRRLIKSNFAFVTHLQHSTRILEEKYQARHTYTMYLGSPDPLKGQNDKAEARRAVDLPNDAFVVAVAGYLQGNKQVDVCLRAVARLKDRYPNILPVLVGPINPHDGYDEHLFTLIDSLGIRPLVRLTGYVPKSDLVQYLIACDVQVNLRYPSFGQMSSTLSRGIAAGKPVIITDTPEWRFFPEDFCWRVPPEDTEGLQLEQYIRTLIENPALVEAMGRNARDFYIREGTTSQAAECLIRIVDDVIQNVPKEVMSQPPFGLVSWDTHNEYVQRTHEQWLAVKTTGTRNWLGRNLPRIPFIGSLVHKAYRLLVNIYKIRQLREAEHGYYHAVALSLNSIHASMNAFYEAFHHETSLLHNEISLLHEKLYDIGEQLIDVYPLPQARVLESPFVHQGRDAKEPACQIAGVSRHHRSEEEFNRAPGEIFHHSEEMFRRKQERIFSLTDEIVALENPDNPVLNMGCGRGEFLSILRDRSLKAVGTEMNSMLIDHLRHLGDDVHRRQPAEYLQNIAANSLTRIAMPLKLFHPFHLPLLIEPYQFQDLRLIVSESIPVRGTFAENPWLHLYKIMWFWHLSLFLRRDYK